ncbi:MAG: NAD(P)/FAD-dependent oxidoreductase [Leptolyngbya sp. RL_3_1]|nr:NAD(P)/FAD-dependent oxidoreductase [Leptolyngbya sp. RL_3_1]
MCSPVAHEGSSGMGGDMTGLDPGESLQAFYAEANRAAPDAADPLGPAWSRFQAIAALVTENTVPSTLSQLMAAGVDVIRGQPSLLSGLRVQVGDRRLTPRKLLLALPGEWQPPDLPGLGETPYLTPVSLAQLKTLPQSLIILGSSPLALEIAQALARWGVAVTLITPSPQLLPSEEPSVSQWITAELTAAGVEVHLGMQPTAVTTGADGICVYGESGNQGDSRRWMADRLLIGTSPRPVLADLNLAAVGVRLKNQAISVNRYLQTRHPYIYACGAVLGGDCLSVACHEAAVAVENALFWNRRPTRYDQLPYTLLTQPEFCRVGMTIAQAQQRYGPNAVNRYDAVLDGNRKAQALGNTTGFCRLVAHRRGQLLGAHLVGPQASEWGQVLAIARQHCFTLQDLAQLPTLPQTLTDLVRQAAAQWEGDRWQPGQWRRDWAENWFNWRRSSRR